MTGNALGAIRLGAVVSLALGLSLVGESTGPAVAACDAQSFAGVWRNRAPAEGSDVVAAEIRIDCRRNSTGGRPGPKAEVALSVRCLRYVCAWSPVPAIWVDGPDASAALAATYDEERVERLIAVTAPEAGRIRLTVTTRFRTVPLEPRRVTYVLERVGD